MRIIKRAALFVVVAALFACAMLMTAGAASVDLEIWDGSIAEEFAGGDGSKESPYIISDGSHLALLMKIINETTDESNSTTYGVYYKLVSDIYLNDIEDYEEWDEENAPENIWTPGGGVFNYEHIGFAGVLDGGGFDVKGIYVNRKDQYNGLFGYLFNADIKDLNITHSYINGGQYTAGLAGYIRASKRSVTLSGCSVSDTTVIGISSVGGVVGYLESYGKRTVVEKCSSNATVSSKYDYAGGIAGFLAPYGISYNYGEQKDYIVKFTDCINYGNITANIGVGGIIGSSQDIVSDAFIYPEDDSRYVPPEKQPRIGVLLERCVNTGKIRGSKKSGSVAGILGPDNRDDQFVEIDLVGCYGTGEDLYGVTRSTLSSKDSKIIENYEINTKSTYTDFNFDNIWSIIGTKPVLRRFGDAFDLGGTSGRGVFETVKHIMGFETSADLEEANVDSNGDGEITLADLNAYMNLLRGKGARVGFSPESIAVWTDGTRFSDTDYLADVILPMGAKVSRELPAKKIYSAGDILISVDGAITDRAPIGNAYNKGSVLVASNSIASGVGYVEVDSYDSELGILTVKGSDRQYVITDGTVVSFSDKSEGASVRQISAETLGSSSSAYRQDGNKDNPLRVLLCVKAPKNGGNTYEVYFAMIVRD